jgi:hypothetical protein
MRKMSSKKIRVIKKSKKIGSVRKSKKIGSVRKSKKIGSVRKSKKIGSIRKSKKIESVRKSKKIGSNRKSEKIGLVRKSKKKLLQKGCGILDVVFNIFPNYYWRNKLISYIENKENKEKNFIELLIGKITINEKNEYIYNGNEYEKDKDKKKFIKINNYILLYSFKNCFENNYKDYNIDEKELGKFKFKVLTDYFDNHTNKKSIIDPNDNINFVNKINKAELGKLYKKINAYIDVIHEEFEKNVKKNILNNFDIIKKDIYDYENKAYTKKEEKQIHDIALYLVFPI